MHFKKIIRILHLWLGLASGSVVFVVAVTGCIWTFEPEISDAVYAYRTVEPQEKSYISVSKIREITAPYFSHISNISFLGKDKSVQVRRRREEDGRVTNQYVYLNPYSGEVLHVQMSGHTFFDVVIRLHTNLMLGKTGGAIVAIATLVCLVMIISGIVLWWPKNRTAAGQRFIFRWKKGLKWKRKNYDLHNILGFYASWIAVFIVLTGVAWSFEWMDRTVYFMTSGGKEYRDYTEYFSTSGTGADTKLHRDDEAIKDALQRFGKPAEKIYCFFPDKPTGSISVFLNPAGDTWYTGASYYYDQRTGDFLGDDLPENMNGGQTVRNMYYDIHVGAILGLPGRLLAFFASLVVASLPITGLLIRWGKMKKYKAKEAKSLQPEAIC